MLQQLNTRWVLHRENGERRVLRQSLAVPDHVRINLALTTPFVTMLHFEGLQSSSIGDKLTPLRLIGEQQGFHVNPRCRLSPLLFPSLTCPGLRSDLLLTLFLLYWSLVILVERR